MDWTSKAMRADSRNTIFTAFRGIFAEIPVHLFGAVTSSPALLPDISAGQSALSMGKFQFSSERISGAVSSVALNFGML